MSAGPFELDAEGPGRMAAALCDIVHLRAPELGPCARCQAEAQDAVERSQVRLAARVAAGGAALRKETSANLA